ncbi:MAG: hypothetical protein COV71_05935 [Candidatus Omnitrophica bacterium CG11_big_fil_rev_8_21_14_0_20_41_12]|nr:MAG: hypothetical protein COV71_05935 [Candidatus Omnitrophica bacterium CG11_big_fil_rev_8_21_14_0_20_41_12]
MFKAEITHNSDFAFTVKTGENQFLIDAKGKGLTPLNALLAGLGSCIGVYIRKYAEGGKLSLEGFQVNVSADLSGPAPFFFRQISVDIDLKNCPLDERRQKALLEFIKNCPAHYTLKGNPQIDFKLIC